MTTMTSIPEVATKIVDGMAHRSFSHDEAVEFVNAEIQALVKNVILDTISLVKAGVVELTDDFTKITNVLLS